MLKVDQHGCNEVTEKHLSSTIEKWMNIVIKRDNLLNKLQDCQCKDIRDLTNMKVGPPVSLDREGTHRWNWEMDKTLIWCVTNILSPTVERMSRMRWNNMITDILGKLGRGELYNGIEKDMIRGMERIERKGKYKKYEGGEATFLALKRCYDIPCTIPPSTPSISSLSDYQLPLLSNKNSSSSSPFSQSSHLPLRKELPQKILTRKSIPFVALPLIPPPPAPLPKAPTNKSGRSEETGPEDIEEAHIGSIRRGEPYNRINTTFSVNTEAKSSVYPENIVAWAIYGVRKRQNILRSSIVKYMKYYRKLERAKFAQRTIELKTGRVKMIRTWEEGLYMIEKQRSVLGKWEFQIVAHLYQLAIRFFKLEANTYICSWQTSGTYRRVINILYKEGDWSLLEEDLGCRKQQSTGMESDQWDYQSKKISVDSMEGDGKAIEKKRERGRVSENKIDEFLKNSKNVHHKKLGTGSCSLTEDRSLREGREEKAELEKEVEGFGCRDIKSVENEGLIDREQLEQLDTGGQEDFKGNQREDRSDRNIDRAEDNNALQVRNSVNSPSLITRSLAYKWCRDSEDLNADISSIDLKKARMNNKEVEDREGVNRGELDTHKIIVDDKDTHFPKTMIDKDMELWDSKTVDRTWTMGMVVSGERQGIGNDKEWGGMKWLQERVVEIEKPDQVETYVNGRAISRIEEADIEPRDSSSLHSFSSDTHSSVRGWSRSLDHLISDTESVDLINLSMSNKKATFMRGDNREVLEIKQIENVDESSRKNNLDNDIIATLFPEEWVDVDKVKSSCSIGKEKSRKSKLRRKWRNLIRGIRRRELRKKEKTIARKREIEQATRLVFDFTSKGLTQAEVELLGKGESFCLTNHKIDVDSFKVDLYKYQRRLRLHEEFKELDNLAEGDEESNRVNLTLRYSSSGRRSASVANPNMVRRENIETRIGVRNSSRGGTNHRETQRNIVNARHSIIRDRVSVQTSREGNIQQEPLESRVRSSTRTSIAQSRRSEHMRKGELDPNMAERVLLRNARVSSGRSIAQSRGEERSVKTQTDSQAQLKERKLPSNYDPISYNRNLIRYNMCIQEESLLAIKKKVEFRDNITYALRKAFKTIQQRIEEKEIIITRADKGSGLVAVDYNTYIEKGTKYIQQEAKAYSPSQDTEERIINSITKKRDGIVKDLRDLGIISGPTATFSIKQLEEKITGMKFYFKIHKDTNINTMPLRPLQSCIAAPTHHLSLVLTDLLQPLLNVKHIPSFIYDSNQLLLRLHTLGSIPEDSTLISSDVSALYPSIPHEAGLKCMSEFLRVKTRYSEQQILAILQALKLVITENYVQWNNIIYKQTSGVAMGTPVAVAYANIFMDWVDDQIRLKAPFVYDHIRYIDDNLFILPKNRIGELMEIANNILAPHIKFTYEELEEGSETGLPFLDTQLFISKEWKIESRLYTKKTDRHAYLLPTSFHPTHITKNIPASVFSRIKRICSRDVWFEEDAEKARVWLGNRGYGSKHIKDSLNKIQRKDRWEMILDIEKKRMSTQVQEHKDAYRIPIILTYSQHGSNIKKVLSERQNLLDSSFHKTRVTPRVVFRRQKNINDLIIQKGLRGPIKQILEEEKIFSRCGDRPKYRLACPCKGRHRQDICRCCAHSKSTIDGVVAKIHKPINCKSKNVVYLIGCSLCSMRYVGETQQTLRDRLMQHLNNIDKLNQPLYTHFKHSHKPANLFIGVLETIRSIEPAYRKIREAWWINKLQTLEPKGLNVKLECNQIYTDIRN